LRNDCIIKLIKMLGISVIENKMQDRRIYIYSFLISELWIGIPFTVGGILVFILTTRTLILVLHCISILILFPVSTSDDETGYSVYLGFPGSRATYLPTLSRRASPSRKGYTLYAFFTHVHFLTLIALDVN